MDTNLYLSSSFVRLKKKKIELNLKNFTYTIGITSFITSIIIDIAIIFLLHACVFIVFGKFYFSEVMGRSFIKYLFKVRCFG